jgi:hypothetical protein
MEAQSLRHAVIHIDDYRTNEKTAKQQISNAKYFLDFTGTISKRRLALEYDAQMYPDDND